MHGDEAALVLDAAIRAGARWAELFVEERDAETVRLDGGRVAELRSDRDVGAAVRVMAGETVGLAYTNRLTGAALVEAAEAASAAATAAPGAAAVTMVDLTETPVAAVQRALIPPTEVSSAAKVALLRRADDAARAHDRAVKDVTAIHVDVDQRIMVARSDGSLTRDHRVRTRLTCRVTASRDGRRRPDSTAPVSAAASSCTTTTRQSTSPLAPRGALPWRSKGPIHRPVR